MACRQRSFVWGGRGGRGEGGEGGEREGREGRGRGGRGEGGERGEREGREGRGRGGGGSGWGGRGMWMNGGGFGSEGRGEAGCVRVVVLALAWRSTGRIGRAQHSGTNQATPALPAAAVLSPGRGGGSMAEGAEAGRCGAGEEGWGVFGMMVWLREMEWQEAQQLDVQVERGGRRGGEKVGAWDTGRNLWKARKGAVTCTHWFEGSERAWRHAPVEGTKEEDKAEEGGVGSKAD
ncbi:unnamed protein product [Closterium sp. NIES-64]|nr:unnamed protein product [Closterium sp. NIES-64]